MFVRWQTRYVCPVANQVALLVLGFVLTTVVGGILGYYFQLRTWDANRRESERTAAADVFEDVSRAMDERLYRMRQLYWGLKARNEERIAAAMDEYRSALVKWNDNLNRNLALVYRYFGRDVWAFLSGTIYQEFAVIGRHLEKQYRAGRVPESQPPDTAHLHLTGRRLQALSNDIYELNRYVIAMIQRGAVGLYVAGAKVDEPRIWEDDLAVGSKSTRVAAWQRNLGEIGHDPLEIDGWFGRATREATIAFQAGAGLEANGVVNASTRSKMAGMLAAPSPRDSGGATR
jgi:hypothetical protein